MRLSFTILPFVFALAACSGGSASESSGSASGSAGGTGGAGSSGTSGSSSASGSGGTSGSGGNATSGSGGGGGESVTLRSQPCEKSPPSATKCESYEVVCGGAAPAIVDLAFFDADAGIPKVGAILFGSGGDGTGFYNFTQRNQLTSAGYTVVDRRWPAGWFAGATDGPQQAACRLAAVIRFLKSTLSATEVLCATGNSGGSAELGYALTWQGAGASLAFAMPSSGPFHRLDLACQGESDATWPGQCAALMGSQCPDCASKSCQLGNGPRSLVDTSFGGTPRCTTPATGDLALLQARSPALGPNAANLDGARTHFLAGKDDPGPYAPLATALHDALAASGADVAITYVTGAPHEMDTTPQGADAIRTTLLAECVP